MDQLINLLHRGLDGVSMRQNTLANNIANVDTPGFKRKDVDFLATLNKEVSRSSGSNLSLEGTNERHFSTTRSEKPFKEVHIKDTSYRNDENNVDIEFEMAELAKNEIYYNTLVRQISSKFSSLNNVIEKGGK